MRRASRVLALLLLAGCGDGEEATRTSPATSGAASPGTGESSGQPAAEIAATDPLADEPPFDVRRLRTEPETHLGQPRVCDIAFADPRIAVEPIEAALYPEGAIARQAIRCAAANGGGWLELVYLDDSLAPAAANQRMVISPVAPVGGRLGYPVATALRDIAPASPEDDANSPSTSGTSTPDPAFDFSRLSGERGGGTHLCAVALVGEVAIVDERAAARAGYPSGTTNRLDLRCVHEGGDSWVDLVFDASTVDRALAIRPLERLSLEVVRPSGGFADRPVVTLTGASTP